MTEDNLLVTDKTQFVIYGAGEVGSNCYKRLRENGFCVVAAIDRNQCGGQIMDGIYTYKIEDFPKAFELMDGLAAVICLADGLAHRNVADVLYQMGFQYIIFLPMDDCINDLEKTRLTQIYNKVLSGIKDGSRIVIKNYRNYYQKDMDVGNSILDISEGYYTVWLGMELLFTESLKLWEGDKTKIHGKDEIKDKSIANDDPHEMLFHYFDLGANDYERYFTSYKGEKTDEQKRNELEKREKLYRLFKREHNKGMRFFIEGAPHVVWNPRNYFNLVGGHHRTMYLLSEGHTVFPVVVSQKDFQKWCHDEIYEKLTTYIRTHQIEYLYAPLPHPGMLNFPVECESFGETKLKCIMRFLAQENASDMDVLDCSRGQGYYARNMERIGAGKVVYADADLINVELAILMNQLLYRDRILVRHMEIKEFPHDETYDIVFVLDRLQENPNCYENDEWRILERITRKYLVLEFCRDETEKSLTEHSRFDGFRLLHREYRAGRIWKTGIFYRE